MEIDPKRPVTLRCMMEKGDVLPMSCLGFSSDDSLNSMIGFISGSASCFFRTLSSLQGSNSDVDGVVTWWTTGCITPNFFSTLKLYERFLLLSEQGFFERKSPFSSADLFRLLLTFFNSVTLVRQGSS
ncbi:hypothetical protein TNCV_3173101 [Trichonephila clavipes]|nr:hypothetical protein TNCV_3173101 [Trichonephila clavipes]